MAADDAAERTEQPTPKRRSEAIRQGQIPRSADLTAAAGLLGAFVLLNWVGDDIFRRMLDLTRELERVGDPRAGEYTMHATRAARAAFDVLLPLLVLMALVGVVASLVQTGGHVVWSRLQPKFSGLNPVTGVRRLFSTEAIQRLGMGVLKMAVVGAVAYVTLAGQLGPVLASTGAEPEGALLLGAKLVYALALRLGLVLLILGLVDYVFQRWRVEKSLKMTKQEVRDEMKAMDGDPVIRQRRRRMQMQLAIQRIRIAVPKARVVVTNPTEYAVALQYDEDRMPAPRVSAKGRDFLALRIRQVAAEHGVPVVQRPPLARALYASVDVGQEIPRQFYRAVAEVLAYVFRLSRGAA